MLDFYVVIDWYHVWCLVSIRLSIEPETFTGEMLRVEFRGVKNSDNWIGEGEIETLLPALSNQFFGERFVKVFLFVAEEESKSNFPWKVDRSDEPVVYTEENEEKDDDDEKNKQSSGVKFSIGFNDEDTNEIVDEDEEEHFKEKGHKQNRHKKKTSRHQDKFERRPSENFVNLADESGNLQEADLEEIAGHRFEKTKGGAVSKISHNKRSMIKIGREDVEMVGKDMKMMSRLGYGFKSELDHTPHALFIEMDELEGEEWEERAR